MKTKNLQKGLMVMSFCLGFVAATNAQPKDGKSMKPPTFSQLLKEMDASEDGKLSETEVKGPLKEAFADVDLNEDGFITEEEFDKAPKPKGKRRGN